MKPVTLHAERSHLTDARVFTLRIDADAFTEAWLKLSRVERGIIENSSESVADSPTAIQGSLHCLRIQRHTALEEETKHEIIA